VEGSLDPAGEALLALDRITRRLRRDCPWDRAQDERSIVPHTVEEAYELADAAHAGDDARLTDELGDVLFQVYFLSLLLEERGAGGLDSVARGVTEKLVRRHPHVFGEGDGDPLADLPTQARTPDEVRENWDAIKQTESTSQQRGQSNSEGMPALLYARKLQRRATAGERTEPTRALAALRARLDGAQAEIDSAATQAAGGHGSDSVYRLVGELLMGIVELSRSLEVDPEVALRLAAKRLSEAEAPDSETAPGRPEP
jgi:MazG family protein